MKTILLVIFVYNFFCLVRGANESYIYSKDMMSYDNAIDFCRARNTDLIKIGDLDTDKKVYEFAKKKQLGVFWINGNDMVNEVTWVDNNNKLLTYLNFNNNQPNGGHTQNCLTKGVYADGTWDDATCNDVNAVICDPVVTIKRSPFEYTYKINATPMTFQEAVNYCTNQSMCLVKIPNPVVNLNVFNLAQTYNLKNYWINANDITTEGRWVDTEDNLLSYKNFFRIEPNGSVRQNCAVAMFYPHGFWDDDDCTEMKSAICQSMKLSTT